MFGPTPGLLPYLRTARPEAYYLTLEDHSGRPLDRVLFTVRGTPQ